ncbi:MAG: hypothetical protein GY705_31645 [Bacteroidetes bacterium]|nr:hypothetical protein [Bacteroidota bacterium]
MKLTILASFLSILFLFSNCTNNSQEEFQMPVRKAPLAENRIEVIDFHTNHRCKTCLKIEKLTKETLAASYSDQIENGVVSFQLINSDDEANEAIVQKFLAFGTTLVLNVINEGEEKHIDLTEFAFMAVSNDEKFTDGLKEHMNSELGELN